MSIKKSHGPGVNRFIQKRGQGNTSQFEYMIKSQKVVQWDVLAFSIKKALRLGLSPNMEGFFSSLNRKEAFFSLENGAGIPVMIETDARCASDGRKYQFLLAEHIPELGTLATRHAST